MKRPRLRADYEVESIPPSHVVLLSEESSFVLQGEHYVRVIPWLDGRHDEDEIAIGLEAELPPAEVYYALLSLDSGGHLVDADDDSEVPRGRLAFWDGLGAGSATAETRLAAASVRLSVIGGLDPRPLAAALAAAGIRVAGDEGGAGLDLIVVDDYLRPELRSLNRDAVRAGRSWVPVKPVGVQLWIGPFFHPGVKGCWQCLAQRLEANRPAARFVARRADARVEHEGIAARHPVMSDLAGALVAAEVVKWFATEGAAGSTSDLLTWDLGSARLARHRFVARPQCRVCGDPALADPRRAVPVASLESRPRPVEQPGGHGSRTPEEAVAAYGQHVDPITGVIRSVRRDPSTPTPLHGFVAVHDFPTWTPDLSSLQQTLAGRSGGQGVTEAEARLSAMGEAFERYSGIWRGEEERVVHCARASLGDSAIVLADCLRFSERQIAARKAWNAAQVIPNHLVPKPLPEDLEIDWTPVRSLTDGTVGLIPTAYCYYGHPDMAHGFCLSDSNGCAAGNTLEEAILSALAELIERDSVAIWWYNRLQRPGVAIESFDVPYARALQGIYRDKHRDLLVVDVTADLGLPTFVASSARIGHEPEDIMLGFGAHPDPRTALVRALREMNQFLPVVNDQDHDGNTLYATLNPETICWLRSATRASQRHLAPDPDQRPRRLLDFSPRGPAGPRGEIERWVALLARQGIRSYLLDQTRPDVGVSTCRVVAPGLRHFWRRLGPGRLYDVPVKMGWLSAPPREDELNPLSIFF